MFLRNVNYQTTQSHVHSYSRCRNSLKPNKLICARRKVLELWLCYLLGLPYDPEDRGSTFPWNVGKLPEYMASHPQRELFELISVPSGLDHTGQSWRKRRLLCVRLWRNASDYDKRICGKVRNTVPIPGSFPRGWLGVQKLWNMRDDMKRSAFPY